MKEYTLKLKSTQIDILYKGLLELPGKYTLDLIEELRKQLSEQTEITKEEKPSTV